MLGFTPTYTMVHMPAANAWFIYILQCADNTLYTGIATDVSARLATHNAGKGAKYTRGRLPAILLYQECAENRSAALQREHAIKKMRAADKRLLIGSQDQSAKGWPSWTRSPRRCRTTRSMPRSRWRFRRNSGNTTRDGRRDAEATRRRDAAGDGADTLIRLSIQAHAAVAAHRAGAPVR